jgi:hypothetical protein
MRERPRDEDILAVLPHARGDDREVLISMLAHAEGGSGVGALEDLLATTRGYERSTALYALASRAGAGSTQWCVEALRSTSFNLQEKAASLLAEVGDGTATQDVLEWLTRKLRSKSRPNGFWSPYTVPAAINFATRHGVHAEVAQILAEHWTSLHKDEHDWLRRNWPGLFAPDGHPAPTAEVDSPVRRSRDIYERFGDDAGYFQPPNAQWWESFDSAYARASRRAARADRS